MEPKVNEMELDRAAQARMIATQNDAFRRSLIDLRAQYIVQAEGIMGRVVVTQGVHGEGRAFVNAAYRAVADFDAFDEDCDPYGDHSFGAVEVDGQKLFWKIDLFDVDYLCGSEAPHDPKVTRRVFTIMTPMEY